MYNASEHRVVKQLQASIENELDRVGLLSRVFSRAKSLESLNAKIDREPGKYAANGRKIQDLFGVRVALYFPDDNQIAQSAIKNLYTFNEMDSTIDVPDKDTFSASRCNLIFTLPQELVDESEIIGNNELVDSTFEVQLRTTLSEGWHEVEHDLRYKCRGDWESHDDLSRALNGIFASLETAEWSMLKLFEELAYRHYKAHEWPQMIRTKFRLRTGNVLSEKIIGVLNDKPELGKILHRLNRGEFVKNLLESNAALPITLDNIFYLCNHFYMKDDDVNNIIPEPIKQICSEL